MKNFLLSAAAILILYFVGPFILVGFTSWLWLPVVFAINDLNIGLGFVIGLAVSIATMVAYNIAYNKLTGENK